MKAYSLLFFLTIAPGLPKPAEDLQQAIQLYQHGQFDQAAELLSKVSQSSPDNAEVRLWFGKALLKIRKWDESVRQMEKAASLEPNNAIYYLWLGRACGGRASHSSWFTAPGWARRVLKSFETAQNLAPSNLDVRFDLMSYYLSAPGFLGGGREKAEEEASAIARLSPRAGYNARALILENDKKWDQARAELIKATSLFPTSANSFVDLADFELDRQEYDEAAEDAGKALTHDANLRRAKMILAAAHIRLGRDLPEATHVLEGLSAGPLTDDDPLFEEVFYWLGEGYLAEGKDQQAQVAFSAALRYDPDFDKARSALSRLR